MFTLPEDPYKILGVSKDAQLPEIRSAHRKLVLKCHPDKVVDPEKKAAKQDEFQRVQKAYEMLSDDNERVKYDDMVRANSMEMENARKRAEFHSSGRTPPRHDAFRHVDPRTGGDPVYRTAEPNFKKTHSFPAQTFYTSARTPPHSWEDNIGHTSGGSYDEARSSRKKTSYEDRDARPSKEERRARRAEEDEWERQRERAKKRDAEDKERELREREKERDRERKEKERKKEEKRKAEKAREKDLARERKKDVETKRSRQHQSPYVEEEPAVYPDPEIIVDSPYPKREPYVNVNVVDVEPPIHKAEKKSKTSSSRTKHELPIRETSRPAGGARDRKVHDNLEFAALYLETSRSKVPPTLNRSQTYHSHTAFNAHHAAPPPAVQTPPPANPAMGGPPPPPVRDILVEEDAARRSSARASARRASHDTPRTTREKSSHKKSSSREQPTVVDDEPVRAMPTFKKSHTMPTQHNSPPVVPDSPPRISRSKTDNFSRPAAAPGLNRAATWYPGEDAQERSRSRHAHVYSDAESEDDRRARRSRRTRSPEPIGGAATYTYSVNKDTGRTTRSAAHHADESRRSAKASYGYPAAANTGRPIDRHDPYGHSGAQFPFNKVKQSKAYDYSDVHYSEVNHTPEYRPTHEELYGMA